MSQAHSFLHLQQDLLKKVEQMFTSVNEEAASLMDSLILHLSNNQRMQKNVFSKGYICATILNP